MARVDATNGYQREVFAEHVLGWFAHVSLLRLGENNTEKWRFSD